MGDCGLGVGIPNTAISPPLTPQILSMHWHGDYSFYTFSDNLLKFLTPWEGLPVTHPPPPSPYSLGVSISSFPDLPSLRGPEGRICTQQTPLPARRPRRRSGSPGSPGCCPARHPAQSSPASETQWPFYKGPSTGWEGARIISPAHSSPGMKSRGWGPSKPARRALERHT